MDNLQKTYKSFAKNLQKILEKFCMFFENSSMFFAKFCMVFWKILQNIKKFSQKTHHICQPWLA